MSTPTYNLRQMEKIVKKNDFYLKRITASHKIYKNANGNTIVLAVCNCNKMIFQRIIKENNLII